MPTFKSLDQAVAEMLQVYEYRSGIQPDTTPGGILLSTFEAVGFQVEAVTHAFDTGITDGIVLGAIAAYGLTLNPATSATTSVLLSRAAPAPRGYLVPAGTRVQTPSGVAFETTTDTTLAQGGTSTAPAPVRALEAGAGGNVPAGSLTRLATLVPGVEAVTNPAGATGGADAETLGQLKLRLATLLVTQAHGTLPAMTLAALTVTVGGARATQATVMDHYLDPSIPGAVARVYLYRRGGVPADLRAGVLKALEADQRPPGVSLETAVIAGVPVPVAVTVVGPDPGALSVVRAKLLAFDAALGVGEDVDRDRLQGALENGGPLGYTVRVTQPAASVVIGPYERAELGSPTLTFTTGGPT